MPPRPSATTPCPIPLIAQSATIESMFQGAHAASDVENPADADAQFTLSPGSGAAKRCELFYKRVRLSGPQCVYGVKVTSLCRIRCAACPRRNSRVMNSMSSGVRMQAEIAR